MPEDQTETRASKLADQFDFAFSVHTHHSFTRPALEFARLDALLRPHGWLAYLAWNHDLLTEAPVPLAACDCDCALTLSSLRWVADNFGWALETPQPGLALFQKVRRTLGVA